MKNTKYFIILILIISLSIQIFAQDQVIGISIGSVFEKLEKETSNVGLQKAIDGKCTFALMVGEEGNVTIEKLRENLNNISVLKEIDNKFVKDMSIKIGVSLEYANVKGGFYIFYLNPGKYKFEQNINAFKDKFYPGEDKFIEISIDSDGYCKIYKKVRTVVSMKGDEENKKIISLSDNNCSPIFKRIIFKKADGTKILDLENSNITLDLWNELVVKQAKNKIEFDKSNAIMATFMSQNPSSCPYYQYTFEIWTINPTGPCEISEECKATVRIQTESGKTQTPITQPITVGPIALNSNTKVYTKGKGEITLGQALGNWEGEKTVWIRAEGTTSQSHPLYWHDSVALPVILVKTQTKPPIPQPPVTTRETIIEDLSSKGWDKWILFEKTITADLGICSTIVECMAKIDSWLIEKLKKKLIETRNNQSIETQDNQTQIKNKEIKVFIDPGHGGKDHGATFENIAEKNLNLKVALKLKEFLEKEGFTVGISRLDDSFIEVTERVKKANSFFGSNEKGRRVFISIHFDSTDPTKCHNLSRTSVIWPNSNNKAINFARYLEESIRNRGISGQVKIGSDNELTNYENLGVLRECSENICTQTDNKVLLELEFMCNKENLNKINSESWQNNVASAIVEAIKTYFEKINLKWHENIYATIFTKESSKYPGMTAYGMWEESCPNYYCIALPCKVGKGKLVEICSEETGKCVKVPVGDLGPWCTNDCNYVYNYARPLAEENKGKIVGNIENCNGNVELVSNGAGIDLTPNVAKDLFGTVRNGYVKWRFLEDV